MKKIFLYRDEDQIERLKSNLPEQVARLNKIIKSYNQLGLGDIDSMETFKEVIYSPSTHIKQLLLDTIPDKNPHIDYEKTLILPGGLEAFEKLVKGIMNSWYITSLRWETLTFRDGLIAVDYKALDEVLKGFDIYAETEQEIQIYNAQVKFIDACNELERLNIKPLTALKRLYVNGEYKINPMYIKPPENAIII